MRVQEIRALSDSEMVEQLEASRSELFNLRFRLATRQLANHQEVRKVKKTIARMKTLQRERALIAARSATP